MLIHPYFRLLFLTGIINMLMLLSCVTTTQAMSREFDPCDTLITVKGDTLLVVFTSQHSNKIYYFNCGDQKERRHFISRDKVRALRLGNDKQQDILLATSLPSGAKRVVSPIEERFKRHRQLIFTWFLIGFVFLLAGVMFYSEVLVLISVILLLISFIASMFLIANIHDLPSRLDRVRTIAGIVLCMLSVLLFIALSVSLLITDG